MSETKDPDANPFPPLRVKPLKEAIPLVQAHDEQNRATAGVPTKAEVETSDPRIPAFMCDPFLEETEFLTRTEHAEAIIVVAFATGAMPDRLVPAIQQRLQEGIPVFILSNNPGEDHGPLKVTYAAGKGAYNAGAVRLEKVNVNHHLEVKAAILSALDSDLRGDELAKKIGQQYTYQEGEEKPIAEWDRPDYVQPPPVNIRELLRKGGFTDDAGNYLPPSSE